MAESGVVVHKALNKHLPYDLLIDLGGGRCHYLQVKTMSYDSKAGAFRMPLKNRAGTHRYKQSCHYMVGFWQPEPKAAQTILLLDLNEVGWEEDTATFWVNTPTYNKQIQRYAHNHERIPEAWLKPTDLT